jgi:hypothetical protein
LLSDVSSPMTGGFANPCKAATIDLSPERKKE